MEVTINKSLNTQRNRFNHDGFDIDLTYLTDRVIVMGNPYQDDKVEEYRRFYSSRHANHHRIINLSSESDYNIEIDLENVETYPFNANNPCPLSTIIHICANVDAYLNVDPDNIVAFHCKTGKGRSCLLAACCLLHAGLFDNADDVIAYINEQRTPSSLDTLVVPSQIRYIHYYETLLRVDSVACSTYIIDHIRMTTIPSFNSSIVNSGCSPYITISVLAHNANNNNNNNNNKLPYYPKRVYNQLNYIPKKQLKRYRTNVDEFVDFNFLENSSGSGAPVTVRGDVCISIFSKEEKMCQIYFNSCFVVGNYLCFDKSTIDLANRDKYDYIFDNNFKIEVLLHKINDNTEINILPNWTNADGLGKKTMKEEQRKELEFIYSYGDTNIEEKDDE
eukprot:gene4234-6011_t